MLQRRTKRDQASETTAAVEDAGSVEGPGTVAAERVGVGAPAAGATTSAYDGNEVSPSAGAPTGGATSGATTETSPYDELGKPDDDGVGILGRSPDPERDAREEREALGRKAAKDSFGGMNPGAAFFGWLVALSCTALATGVIGALVATVGGALDVDQSAAERAAGTIGIVAACVLLVVAAVGWYAGGYVAGRMSRFDGGRQGLGVWLIGLLAMFAAVGVGALFGTQYNALDRSDLPQLPISGSDASTGALIAGGAFLLVTLVAAVAGGKVGRRYHAKVDRAHLVD